MTHINDTRVNEESNAPFGGEPHSTLSCFNGEWILEEFTTLHRILAQHEPRDYPF
ncbi:hypothetical protein [Psychrobacter sp. DM4]|uniref:hypothetical protein n=1 Tax=Psychrobacter sp. DM4 TaxID=3440637 RepID=UPI003F4F98A0